MHQATTSRHRSPALPVLVLAALLHGCGGGAAGGGDDAPAPAEVASEAEWQALARPRPEPLPGAPRVTVGEVRILGSPSWSLAGAVEPGLAVAELATAGLLDQETVHFVERRRFAEAARAERRGLPRPDEAPPAGVSPGADLMAAATWASVGLDSAYLELRLTEVESGATVATRRASTATDADPVAVARTLAGNLLALLDAEGLLPDGASPEGALAVPTLQATQVPPAAVTAFARGLAAEEEWSWEAARRGYQEALMRAGDLFPEARAALARTARLRNGGTLGQS